MSRKRLMRGIGRITISLTIIAGIIAAIVAPSIYKAKKINVFVNNAEIIEVVVGDGHGITHYSSQFRPEWIKVEEYNILITELNNLPQSGEIYSGQIIKFYK